MGAKIEKMRLGGGHRARLGYDDSPLSPRDPRYNDNLSRLICFKHPRYDLGDRHHFQDEAEFLAQFAQDGENPEHLYRIYMYEHGGFVFKAAKENPWPPGMSWDVSRVGYAYVPEAVARENSGLERKENRKQAIDAELAEYGQYANGDVYAATVKDRDGNKVFACGGYLELDQLKEMLTEQYGPAE